ncbi:hypothetical protein PI125_g14358 [Phytophthora idaei]|nr:hypothetical protein PI125_g14358 [Phytophthora idaei]
MVAPLSSFRITQELALWRQVLLSDRHERRIRRAEQKGDNQGALQKKETR